jgi:hypothetical protein
VELSHAVILEVFSQNHPHIFGFLVFKDGIPNLCNFAEIIQWVTCKVGKRREWHGLIKEKEKPMVM